MVLKINDICKKLGLSSRTLRVWEDAGLLSSIRDATGIRCFNDDIFERIERIQILKEFGLSLGDIAAILSGKAPIDMSELLNRRRDEIEAEARRLSDARRKLMQVTDLVGGTKIAAADYSELLVPPEEAKANALRRLLQERGLHESAKHAAYLEQEFSTATPEETLAWIAAYKRIARYAHEHEIPLNFVRGVSSARLALHLCNWGTPDPVAENLIPRQILRPFPDVHFDVPYSGTMHFFEFINSVNADLPSLKLVPFRLPVLDVLQQFASETGNSILDFESEEAIITLLRSGDLSDIFLVDESGDTLLERIYPETPPENRSTKMVAQALAQFNPKNRNELLRFLALHREKTRDLFDDYANGKDFTRFAGSKLSRFIPAESRGYLFFHDDIILPLQLATGWPLERVSLLRRNAWQGKLSDALAGEFAQVTDSESLECLRFWGNKTFCRAHYVGWWPLVAATASCKLRDPVRWQSLLRAWEKEHQLAWNDFGVVCREARILTSH